MAQADVPELGVLLTGALVGITATWLFRPAPNRELFLSAVSGAWVGVGLLAAFRGKLSLRGRTGPGTQWRGTVARLLGIIIAVVGAFVYFRLLSL